MFFNKKARALRSAEKYVAQGKLSLAIEEYRKIVESDPSDLMTVNTLGDLYVRVGRIEEAIQNFLFIAENYRESGFTLKAIAMYKKISKLSPQDVDICLKLATLYTQQGLVVDARHQYLNVAERYLREGQVHKAFDIYQRIADLEPENTNIRLKLAELYLQEKNTEQAHSSMLMAGAELMRQGKLEASLQVYERAIQIFPGSRPSLMAMAEIYSRIGQPQRAIDLLNSALEENPGDTQLLTLLGRTYIAAEMMDEAEATLLSLVQLDKNTYENLFQLGDQFLKQGNLDRAAEQMDGCIDILISQREEDRAVEFLHEILKKDMNHVPSLTRLIQIYTRIREIHSLIATLDWLAEAAARKGQKEIAVDALQRLINLDKHNPEYRRRLRDLGVTVEDEEAIPIGESMQSSIGAQPATVSVTGFDVIGTSSASVFGPDSEGGEGDLSPDVALEQEIESVDFFIAQGFIGVAREALAQLGKRYPNHKEVLARLKDLDAQISQEDEEYSSSEEAPLMNESGATWKPEMEFTFAGAPDVQLQGPSEISEDEESVIDSGFVDNQIDYQEKLLEAEWSAIAESEIEPNLLGLEDEISSESGQMEPFDLLSLPDEGPVKVVQMIDPISSHAGYLRVQSSDEKTPDAEGMGIDKGLLDIFEEFKSSLEEETVTDFTTRYQLGIAYKDMEMFDEAIAEFQTAIKAVTPDDPEGRYLQCCSLLGFCFMRKGMAPQAILWLQKGLNCPGRSEDEYQALRYDLGLAYEQSGDLDKAFALLSEVYAVDVKYRDVAEKLKQIRESRGAEVIRS